MRMRGGVTPVSFGKASPKRLGFGEARTSNILAEFLGLRLRCFERRIGVCMMVALGDSTHCIEHDER
jgi:hypothetical protein